MTSIRIPEPPQLVAVTVNGREMQLPKGKNLLQALLDVGIYVPHYCYHPCLSVAGNCRLCLIELEGRPKPEISCNMIVADGLKIRTDSPLVEDCRKGMMEFLLANHPLDCPVCDRGGECMLQRYAMEYGWGTARTTDERRRFPKPQFDPLIDIERNRCIMCTRCVRFCDEVAGEHVMGVFSRGNRNYIGTYGDGPVSNPFSGNVIDICPVGCLTSKPFRFKARDWELRQTPTTGRVCNGPVTAWTRGGRLYRVTPPLRKHRGLYTIDEDTTRFISNESRFGSLHVNSGERLLQPLARKAGRLAPATWDEALGAAADALGVCAPGQSCFLAGERSTNEEFFLLARLARVACRTPYLDWRSRFVSEEAAQAAGLALSASDGDFDLLDRRAYPATLMISTDPLATAPDVALRIREAARLGRTLLGLLDARIDDWFAQRAATACLETPEDLAGVVDRLTKALARGTSPENAPLGAESLFRLLAENDQGLVILGLDHAGGVLNPALVPAVLRLLRVLGPTWHFLALTAARNAKGAFHCGGQSDRLPTGHARDANARQRVAQLWGATPNPAVVAKATSAESAAVAVIKPAPAAPELLRMAAAGRFKVLFLHRCDELVTHPQRRLVERALEATPTVIAVDILPSWITERASVVLPGSVFYETDATMTDIDGTIQRMSRGFPPPGSAQEEWRIVESLADLLGATKRFRAAQEIFTQLNLAWGAQCPFRLDDFKYEGPGIDSPQRQQVFSASPSQPDFKLHAHERPDECGMRNPESGPTAPLRLLWNHHAQGPDHLGSRSEEFDALRPRPAIELAPSDAARLGLSGGDWVVFEGGSTEPSRVAINPRLAPGVAYGASNVLGLRLTEDIGGLPPVVLRKTDAPDERDWSLESGVHRMKTEDSRLKTQDSRLKTGEL